MTSYRFRSTTFTFTILSLNIFCHDTFTFCDKWFVKGRIRRTRCPWCYNKYISPLKGWHSSFPLKITFWLFRRFSFSYIIYICHFSRFHSVFIFPPLFYLDFFFNFPPSFIVFLSLPYLLFLLLTIYLCHFFPSFSSYLTLLIPWFCPFSVIFTCFVHSSLFPTFYVSLAFSYIVLPSNVIF